MGLDMLTFQLTLPVWGATDKLDLKDAGGTIFQLTLPVWGATRVAFYIERSGSISTHAPRVGSDLALPPSVLLPFGFQLTLPVWGATAEFQ